MKSSLIAAAVVALTALTAVLASADTFNPYLWDQMRAPATRTRAEVKAEVLQALREGAPRAEKAGAAPQAAPNQVKPSE